MHSPEYRGYDIPNEMTGDLPVKYPNDKLFNDRKRGILSCYGVNAEGPRRHGVLSGTIGTKKHAEEELVKWKKKAPNLTLSLVHLLPGQTFLESVYGWGFLPVMPIKHVHGFRDDGQIKADKRRCRD